MADGFIKKDIQLVFGQVLRKHRNAVGISQERLALECELDRTYISLLERGLRTPSLWVIFVLSNRLGVAPDRMVRDVEQQLLEQ